MNATRWLRALAWATAVAIMLGAPSVAAGAGFDVATRAELARIVTAQIDAKRLPGAVIVAGDSRGIFYREAFGMRELEPATEPMSADTVFDLASLTKVVATTTAILQLVERHRIDLDAPVIRYWPAFGTRGKAAITVRELLAHTSGMRADLPDVNKSDGRVQVLREIVGERLYARPGERVLYSDLNFVVLGELVRRVTRHSLDDYCRQHIFLPLAMRDTDFQPDAEHRARTAATTFDGTVMLRGRVHDPTAARLGAVAGNAGLFSTADDLARFAQMMLNGGQIDHARVLRPETIAMLAAPATPLDASAWRGLGWDLSAPLAANHDRLPAVGTIQHTGYTGTGIWIDLVTRRFVIILTNRVHPDDSGDARPLRAQILGLVASHVAPASNADIVARLPSTAQALAYAERLPVSSGPVLAGIDVLESLGFQPLIGKRIGLLTNRSGFDARGIRTVDVLAHAPGVTLAALFSPEHGLDTDQDAPVADTRDRATGLVVHSLYGSNRHPAAETLADLDAVVVDLQDTGVRFFTYSSTVAYLLEAAAKRGIPVFILDRPNPLGGEQFGGPMPDVVGSPTFTGYFPVPLLHGMTLGELALMFNNERHIGAEVHVVRMLGYRRSMRFADTGLGWVAPSPNLRTLEQLDMYPDTGLIEGANISVARGTPSPFLLVGAPWIDGTLLASALNQREMGVRFEAVDFVPTESTYHGNLCHGVRIIADARVQRVAGRIGLLLAATLGKLYPAQFELGATRDSIGSAAVWQLTSDDAAPPEIEREEALPLQQFASLRATYLLY